MSIVQIQSSYLFLTCHWEFQAKDPVTYIYQEGIVFHFSKANRLYLCKLRNTVLGRSSCPFWNGNFSYYGLTAVYPVGTTILCPCIFEQVANSKAKSHRKYIHTSLFLTLCAECINESIFIYYETLCIFKDPFVFGSVLFIEIWTFILSYLDMLHVLHSRLLNRETSEHLCSPS